MYAEGKVLLHFALFLFHQSCDVCFRVCPYKTTSIEVSKFPSARINRLVIQLRFLSQWDSPFVTISIEVDERFLSKFSNPSFITCLTRLVLTTSFQTIHIKNTVLCSFISNSLHPPSQTAFLQIKSTASLCPSDVHGPLQCHVLLQNCPSSGRSMSSLLICNP